MFLHTKSLLSKSSRHNTPYPQRVTIFTAQGINSRVVQGVILRPLACWYCGFESRWGHECLSVSCRCCVLSDRGLCVVLQEFYRVWCVWVWLWNLDNGEALAN